MENKVYALVGPHASGKGRFAKEMQNVGLHYVPFYTTGSIRQESVAPGQTPIALPMEKIEFFKTDFIVKDTYKGDYIGVKRSDILEAINSHPASIVILTPAEIKQITPVLRSTLETIYLMSDYVTIVERMLMMGCNNDEINYHLKYAENNHEFDLWKTARHVIKNTGEAADVVRQLMAIIGLTVPVSPTAG